MIRAVFVSDIHLKTMEERNSQTLLRSLRSWADGDPDSRPTHLFLVGDIFDLWIGSHDFFARRFQPLVAAIEALVKVGVQVHFFEGNHDLYLKPFWEDRIGARVHADAQMFDLDGYRVRVEHGDLINPEDTGYLFLRSFLRAPAMVWLARHLPAVVVRLIGEKASSASREYTSTAKELSHERIRALIRAHAARVYAEAPFDLIVTGHVHIVDDQVLTMGSGGREVRSVNLGSWFDAPKALLLEPNRSLLWLQLE